MAFVTGFTYYYKKKWLDALAALGLKIAFYSTTTGLDASTNPATPLVYTVTGELTSSGTGYTAGGYLLSNMAVSASGTGFVITADDVVTGTGSISTGTYGAMIYDPADSNRAVAICQVNVTVASSGGIMTFDIPADALKIV